jgi:hypothetical protein
VSSAVLTNPYKFYVYRNTAQNTSAAAFVILGCDTAVFDTGSNVDLVTHKGRFTAPVAGFYHFNGEMETGTYSGTGYLGISLMKNGLQTLNGTYLDMTAWTNSIDSSMVVSGMLQLAANDYVEIGVYASATVALVTGSALRNFFQGFLISTT